MTDRIDVHAHYFPPAYRQALERAGMADAGGIPIPPWSAESAIDFMDRHGIAAQVVGVSDPGLWFTTAEEAGAVARASNEFGAELVRAHPTRFGVLALLPLPDVDGAVGEVAHALDVLGLDGVGLVSSYDGLYLGDPRLDPVLAALDERGAYVMVHPATPRADDHPDLGLPAAIVEYPFDTTRAVTNLVWHGALERFPRIRWALSHAGGAAPFLAYRITGLAGMRIDPRPEPWEAFSRLFYDTALAPVRPALRSVLEVAPPSQILFGSDFPFADFLYPPDGDVQPELATVFDAEQLEAVGRHNALAQFPRLAAALDGAAAPA
jgi:predicted TIM-barrel fold metal-dependent hydrolase